VFSGEATNTNFIIFDLTRLGLVPTLYHSPWKWAVMYLWFIGIHFDYFCYLFLFNFRNFPTLWYVSTFYFIKITNYNPEGTSIKCCAVKLVLCGIVAYHQVSILSAMSCREQVTFRWDDDVRFELDQQAYLGFCSAISPKQQLAETHLALLGLSRFHTPPWKWAVMYLWFIGIHFDYFCYLFLFNFRNFPTVWYVSTSSNLTSVNYKRQCLVRIIMYIGYMCDWWYI
jgi:hypothetical protein